MVNGINFMQRAIELAQLGTGHVSPNPLVGCVIIHDNKIIGEGWHQQFGQAHAEVNAVNSVKQKHLLHDAEMYVTLEPCAHFGKTPPCTELIIKSGIRKVIIASKDPNPIVNGQGIEKLRSAGIEVITGMLEAEAEEMNRRFITYFTSKRPYLILKWAETADGFIAREDYTSKWISNDSSRQLVHKWRSEEDAILVGTTTALKDNPSLTVRDWPGRNPLRIVIDKQQSLPESFNIFNQEAKTICYNVLNSKEIRENNWVSLNAETFMNDMITDLYRRKVQSVIVEGGRLTLQSFIDAGLWDELRVFKASVKFGNGIRGPKFSTSPIESIQLGSDVLEIHRNIMQSGH